MKSIRLETQEAEMIDEVTKAVIELAQAEAKNGECFHPRASEGECQEAQSEPDL